MFITLEGVDGSGKSTALKELEKHLKKNYKKYKDFEIIFTREPGGAGLKTSEKIRKIILEDDINSQTEALLFAASRTNHINKLIMPSLKKGKIVICDRFVDSSIAYQGFGRGLGKKEVTALNKFAMTTVQPNITIFFDIPLKFARDRVLNRKRDEDRMEKVDFEFKKRVYQGYQELISENPERFFKIDASQSKKIISQKLIEKFDELFLSIKKI